MRGREVCRRMYPNAGVAALASAFIPGVGQIYNGEMGKGIGLVVAFLLSWALSVIFIGFLLLPFVYGYAIYDAAHTAQQRAMQQVGGRP